MVARSPPQLNEQESTCGPVCFTAKIDLNTGTNIAKKKNFDLAILSQSVINESDDFLYEKFCGLHLPFIVAFGKNQTDHVLDTIDGNKAMGFLKLPVELECIEIIVFNALNSAHKIKKLHRDSVVNLAVGIIMNKANCTRQNAYKMLRDNSRVKNQRIVNAAEEIVNHLEGINQFICSSRD